MGVNYKFISEIILKSQLVLILPFHRYLSYSLIYSLATQYLVKFTQFSIYSHSAETRVVHLSYEDPHSKMAAVDEEMP